MSEFFIKRGEKIHGPFSESQIRAGLKSKKLSSEDLISQNRSGPWETVQSKASQQDGIANESSTLVADVKGLFKAAQPAQFFYKNAEQQTFGPFTVDRLRDEAQSGRLTKNDIVWRGGTNKQYKAADVKGLFKAAQPQTQVASVHPSIVPPDIQTAVPPETANMATQDTVEPAIFEPVNSTGPSDERRATVSKMNSSSSELYRIQNDGLLIKKQAYDRNFYEGGALAKIFTHFLAEKDQKETFNGKPRALLPLTSLQSVCTHGHTFKTLTEGNNNAIAWQLYLLIFLFLLAAGYCGYKGTFVGKWDSYLDMYVVDDVANTIAIIFFLLACGAYILAMRIWIKVGKSGLDWHVELTTNDGKTFLFPFATEEEAEFSYRELDALIN